MRIGVNTRLFVKGKMDGLAWFAYEILQRMVKNHPNDEFIFFFDRQPNDEFLFAPNVKAVVLHPQARHPILWFCFFELSLPKAIRKEKIDVFFSPDGFISLRTKIKTFNIIHDLNFEHFPHLLPPFVGWYYRFFFPKFAKKSNRLATISAFSQKDIAQLYGIDAEKITIIPNASAKDFHPITQDEQLAIRHKYTNDKPFFIFVGTANKRKNIANILRAFENFKQKGHTEKLVFAGNLKNWDKEMNDVLHKMSFKNEIIFTNYISTYELNKLLSSATALLYPSLFEGFGVPILEAFACQTPVITSKTSAMPEVAGEAAILVNPMNIIEITDAMCNIVENNELKQILIAKGNLQLQNYSWDNSEALVWNELQKM
ncbi:MAG: glycosyltransferase family 4 protein [Bacteroidales bacterium]|nr:glycosyltransferase family 4 protein [Bacteroidales bacterium]